MACGWCRFFDSPREHDKDGVEWVDAVGECRFAPAPVSVRRSYICSRFQFDRYQSNDDGGRSMMAEWWLRLGEQRATIKKLKAEAKRAKERSMKRAAQP